MGFLGFYGYFLRFAGVFVKYSESGLQIFLG